ncbi:MAG: hypothetical protein CM15mV52_1080 [uncultured marine virus]|nr:MAG: hypothetical protein CM15mV52_1080 [uncultured marine virus]
MGYGRDDIIKKMIFLDNGGTIENKYQNPNFWVPF